ncbi:hypothetical protein SAMN06265348_104126 [Pedobacter westerhofensis]|uniref:Uncharacterized protein n=1 Tax=Pedobacter westerhofensis TaxID=425512 RepID=A0A521CSW4_9SPHI|nr:hypothetical protein [Pedobacter westerhofensis]SMO61730.1 hypothetical protein SAMN06265348_104126 [Pedobacter westerhofensis]
MQTIKANLLQRVRVITIALVTIIGLGTIAMKPAAAPFDHEYGVAETASGTEWIIQADVTDPTSEYDCRASTKACTVGSTSTLNPGDVIPINESQILGIGIFIMP